MPNTPFVPTPVGFPYTLPDGHEQQRHINLLLVSKGPYFLHPEGSPYLGLTVAEQCDLAKLRRNDLKTPKWRLDQMRKATKKDYEKLLLHCTETLVNAWYDTTQRLDTVCVYVRLPFNYWRHYDKTLPRVFIVGHDDWTTVVSWRVDRIVQWLYDNGYSTYTPSELRKSIWAILNEQEKLELYYDIASQTSILELYGEIVEDVKQKRVKRQGYGRGKAAKAAIANKLAENT